MFLALKNRKDKYDSVYSRNLNLDMIRCMAVLLVIAVHFFYNSGYYDRDVKGKAMIVMTFLRTASMICVPLFALLTGYLNNYKKVSVSYFQKICPVLLSYILCCILVLLYRIYVNYEEFSVITAVLAILCFSDGIIPYSWYVEMYIGLFLLIPFLNSMYHGQENQKNKKIMIIVMFILTVIPNAVNVFNFLSPDFLRNPASVTTFHTVFPDWWTGIWPVTYYFIGAYIQEYGIHISIRKNILLIAAVLFVSAAYNIYRSYGNPFFLYFESNWGGVQNTLLGTLTFILLLRLDITCLPGWCKFLIYKISKLSFCIYLCSFLSDQIVYSIFNAMDLRLLLQLICAPVAIMASFAIAAMLAQIVAWLQKGLTLLRYRKTVE